MLRFMLWLQCFGGISYKHSESCDTLISIQYYYIPHSFLFLCQLKFSWDAVFHKLCCSTMHVELIDLAEGNPAYCELSELSGAL